MIRLSICIPTYNFRKFIGQTLDSIIKNIRDNVEIIILDGGSTDDTAQIVAQSQLNCPSIKYHKQNYRGGIDRDIATVISLAQGDYCWLFSADDIMLPGAIDKVLNYINSNHDVYLCEQILCDYSMRPIKKHPVFYRITAPETFQLNDAGQRRRYFSRARTSEAFFSFLSGPIFKRAIWKKADGIPESFYETCWGLAGRLLSLVPTGLTVHYLGEALLYKRGVNEQRDNDSFSAQGMVNRMRISVEGFRHIAQTIFGRESLETFHIRRVLRNEWTLRTLMKIKLMTVVTPQRENIETLKNLATQHYLNAGFWNMSKHVIFRLTPIPLLKLAGLAEHIMLKIRNFLRKLFHIKM